MRFLLLPLLVASFAVSVGHSQQFQFGDWTYTLNDDNEATIVGYSGSDDVVTIPAVVDGFPMLTLGEGFKVFPSFVTSVTIPDSVTSIGDYAFSNCTSLISVLIPDSVTSIGNGAFGGCTSLTSALIPDSVTSIGIGAFAYCDSLSSLSIGKSVTSIGDYAFYSCLNLSSVLFKGTPPILGSSSFADLSWDAVLYYLPSSPGWPATFGGRPTMAFLPEANSPAYIAGPAFEFSWSGTGTIPMNVRRATSLNGPWTVVSTNNSSAHFVDSSPPIGKAFYQAYLP